MEGMTEQFQAFVPEVSQSIERQRVLRTASEVNLNLSAKQPLLRIRDTFYLNLISESRHI